MVVTIHATTIIVVRSYRESSTIMVLPALLNIHVVKPAVFKEIFGGGSVRTVIDYHNWAAMFGMARMAWLVWHGQ